MCAITGANYHGAGQATTIKGNVKIGGEVGYDLPDGLSLLGLLTANCQDQIFVLQWILLLFGLAVQDVPPAFPGRGDTLHSVKGVTWLAPS